MLSWERMSERLESIVAEEHCIGCDNIFYGTPNVKGTDICPLCGTENLLCNLCTISPDCEQCPYERSER